MNELSDTPSWQLIAARKREELLSLIPLPWQLPETLPPPSILPRVTGHEIRQYLSAAEVEITEVDAVDIVRKTSSGEWRCEAVARAFCHRAALAHQMINCLHEIFFEAAIADAKRLDAYYEQHQKPVGPLHGLPVSLKDSLHVKDVDTSMGYVGWLGTFEGGKRGAVHRSHESEIVRELRALGAVLYVKTSVPQGSFSGETLNHIIESTTNPQNRRLVVGGSSGGEGGLLALRGSPVGLGTDIGGSIRVPAAWNGCYGLRPSTGRLPYHGIASTVDGQTSIPFVVGPLAPSAEALTFLVKALLSAQPWYCDPLVHEIPWREDEFDRTKRRFQQGKLSFAVCWSDGVVNPQPPVTRALHTTIDVISSLGHTVVEWKPPSHADADALWTDICSIDGGERHHRALALTGEPATPTIFGRRPSAPVDAGTVMERNIALRTFRKTYQDYWNSTASLTGSGRPVDALIMPVAPGSAPEPGKVRYFGYTTIVNVLDYTASVIPVTRVKEAIDRYPADYRPINDLDGKVYRDYDADLLDGSHVAVQLVGRRLQEESVLALSEDIGRALSRKLKGSSL